MNKNIIILLICLLTAKLSISQKCENQKDPFTNEPVLTFDYSPYDIKFLHFELRKDKRTLEFRAVESGALVYTIPEGSDILMKFENGDTIRLKTVGETLSKANNSGPQLQIVYSEYYLKTEITVEQLQKMASSPIAVLRFPDLHGATIDYKADDMRKAYRKSFTEGAKCMLGKK